MRWFTLCLSLIAPASAMAAPTTVVELFQSQGCSSCPPANENVLRIADRPGVLVLTWEVTYWDYLGWRDTFGDRAFTQRQYAYARSLGHDGVFTPQVIVNGRVDGVGGRRGEVEALIAQAGGTPSGPDLAVSGNTVTVGAGRGHADVVVVEYDPALVQVPVHRGENAGETLPHRNVVRQVRRIGAWTGDAATYTLPAPAAGLRSAVLLQAERTGPILAAIHN